MKKKHELWIELCPYVEKLFMKLKLVFIIIVAGITSATATTSYSQSAKLSLELRNMSLERVLDEIEKQSEFYFVFNQKQINVNRKTDISVKQGPIAEVLQELFTGTGVNYVILDKQILLTPEPISNKIKGVSAEGYQQKKISGSIVDGATGEPIIGANVIIEGTTIGVISDIDGKFSIDVANPNSVLVFSFVGYNTERVNLAGQTSLDIKLIPDITKLDEVVVVGYGTMKKKDLTGSITQIKADKLASENPKTVQDVLRGIPGLNVGYDASAKGGGSMQIRGQRSVYTDGGHNDPLIILDGMIFYGELSEINPDDIAQIDILKDASAAAVYGAKAANGVIIIGTKKGKKGKPIVNITSNIGWSQPAMYRERFSTEDYLQHRQDWYTKNTYGVNPVTGAYEAYQSGNYAKQPGYFMRPDQLPENISIDTWRAYTTNGTDESDQSIWAKRIGFKGNALENFLAGKTTDWSKHAYRTGFNQDYNASISGAGDMVNYYISMGYLKNQGAAINDEYQAIRSNLKAEAKVNNWLEIGANVNFQDRSDGNITMDIDQEMRNSPYADYSDNSGNLLQYPLSSEFSQRGYNYEFEKQYQDLEKGYTVLNSILNAKVKLPFNITYAFNASPRYQFFYDRYFMSAALPGSDPKTRGANREQAKRFDWSLNNTITWDYTFKEKHHTVLTLVQEAENRRYWQDRIEARNILPSDILEFHNTKNGTKENSSYLTYDSHQSADALLARWFYAYDNRYMITTSIRRDGYSAFGSSNPYAYFPSIALAWTFTNEKFFNWAPMSSGKLRASFGKNGNRSLKDPYVALANLSEGAGKMMGYVNPDGTLNLMRYLMADRMANPDLQWEKTTAYNFGLDFGFLNDRISGSIEYYIMQTHDMIMLQRLPQFTGYPNITNNLGQVDNRGIEFSINAVNIDNNFMNWTTTFSISYNKNEIKHLYYQNENVSDSQGNIVGTREMDDKTNGWFIGKPISQIWDYRVTGIWQKDEVAEAKRYGQLPGDPKVANNYTADDKLNADGSVTPVYNEKDKEFLGQTAAPINWSLRNEFTFWKNLSISCNIYSFMGHKSLYNNYLNNDDDGGRMSYALINLPSKDYWTIDNPTNKYGRIEAKGPVGAEGAQRLFNRSFIRLDNISVAYTLPQIWTSKYKVDHVKVFASIRNVAVWSKDWEFGDPEVRPGAGEDNGLSTRVYSLGMNLTF